MAQRVDVAIVFREMLGTHDAQLYMTECCIPDAVATRVLAGMAVTRIVSRAGTQAAANDERSEQSDPRRTMSRAVTGIGGVDAVVPDNPQQRA